MNYNRIIKNILYLFFGNISVKILGATAAILIARYLGAENFGILSVAIAFATVAGYFTDLGLTHTLMREGTKPGADIPVLMGSFLKVRILFSLLTALVSGFIIFIFYEDPVLQQVLFLMVLPTIFGASLQGLGVAYFQVTQEMKYTAFIRSVSGIITAGTLFLAIIFKWSVFVVAVAYGLSSIIGGLYSLWLLRRRINLLRGWNKALLSGLGSFTLAGITMLLIPQLGPLVLEKVNTLTQVGLFAAAYRFPSMLYQIPGILAAAFYPALFELGNKKDEPGHFKLSVLELKTMSFLGILLALPFFIFPEWIIHMLLGEEWLSSSPALRILALVVILQSINSPLADSLTTRGMQARRTFILVIAFSLGFPLYYFLGSFWGSLGGAISAISIECILLFGFVLANPTGWSMLQNIWINSLAFMLTMLFYYLTPINKYPFWGIVLACLIYASIVILLDKDLRRVLVNWQDALKPNY